MNDRRHVVVVGGSAAGWSVVNELTKLHFDGRVTLVSAEDDMPYERPPLSKQFLLGQWNREKIVLRHDLSAPGLAVLPHQRAVGLDMEQQTVILSSGMSVDYDELVIATGVRARTIAGLSSASAFTLRSAHDAEALRTAALHAGRLTIVGGGFIGLEVAATCRELGITVVVIEPDPQALMRRLGPDVANRLIAMHERSGVTFAWNRTLDEHQPVDTDGRIRLDDGSVLPASPILVSIGCTPEVDWLRDGALDLTDGVLCDAGGRAGEHIWAAGDVARWFHVGYGRPLRLEHRQNATDQGRLVARNLLGAGEQWAASPFFWSDQHGVKVQVAGVPTTHHRMTPLEGDPEADSFVLRFDSDDTLPALLSWNAPARMTHHRRDLQLL